LFIILRKCSRRPYYSLGHLKVLYYRQFRKLFIILRS
jgi:hypothetical protein